MKSAYRKIIDLYQTHTCSKTSWSILACLITVVFSLCAESAVIIPQPHSISQKGYALELSADWVIVTETSDKEYAFCGSWLQRKLDDSHSLGLIMLPFEKMPSDKRILIGNPDTNPYIKAVAQRQNITLPATLGNQGYIIEVFSKPQQEIFIMANSQQGTFYGIQTLLQLLESRNINAVSIIDYPDHQIRAVDMGKYGSTAISIKQTRLTENQKQAVDRLAELKINMLSNENVSHFFGEAENYMMAYKELADYCRDRYIEFVPMIGSLREIYWIPFELMEGWWIKDEPFFFDLVGTAIAAKPSINLLAGKDPGAIGDEALKSAGWVVSGALSRDLRDKYNKTSSSRLESGKLYIRIPAEAESYYHLTAYVKGESPVLTLQAIDGNGKPQYTQSDLTPHGKTGWTETGVIIKTDKDTKELLVQFKGKDKIAWLNSIQLRRIDGDLKNVIRSASTDIVVESSNKDNIYKLGIDYEVVNGKTDKIYSNELTPFTIKRISSGSIKPDEHVLVSYDAVLYWSRTSWYNQPPCVSDDRLYTEYYYPAIDKVIKQLNPKMINFASDEIRGFNRDSRNRKRGLKNSQLFYEWLSKLSTYIKRQDPNIRMMIWDDMVSPYHNGEKDDYQLKYGGSKGTLSELVEKDIIPKNVILNSWWYSNQYSEQMIKSVNLYEKKGYSYFGASWKELMNIKSWSELLRNKPHSLGGYLTNWDKSDNPRITEFADWFWNTK